MSCELVILDQGEKYMLFTSIQIAEKFTIFSFMFSDFIITVID